MTATVISRIVVASYAPDHGRIAKENGVSIIDAQFDHPGWTTYGVHVEGPLPTTVTAPSRCDGNFPRLGQWIKATHSFNECGELVPEHRYCIGCSGIGEYPEDHHIHIDVDGSVWVLGSYNHYDPSRSTRIEVERYNNLDAWLATLPDDHPVVMARSPVAA